MCLVRSWKTGLVAIWIVLVLSAWNDVQIVWGNPNSSRRPHSHTISEQAVDMTRYLASVEDLETWSCFLHLQARKSKQGKWHNIYPFFFTSLPKKKRDNTRLLDKWDVEKSRSGGLSTTPISKSSSQSADESYSRRLNNFLCFVMPGLGSSSSHAPTSCPNTAVFLQGATTHFSLSTFMLINFLFLTLIVNGFIFSWSWLGFIELMKVFNW